MGPQTQKVRQNDMAEEYTTDKGTRLKTPEEQQSEAEIGNLHEKELRVMIVKDDSRSQKKNGDTD